jgi:predicted DNA-binding transcriptional regulator YafY
MPPQLRSELSNAVNALLIKREGGMPDGMNLENFQILSPEFAPKVAPEVFLEVYQAWENKHYLQITYSSGSGHDSVKLIEPYVLAWNSGIWYIKGLVAKEDGVPCDPPFKIRVFALHRIQSAEKRPGRFFEDSEDAKRIKKDSLFNFQKLDEVEIEFYPPFVKQMAERFASRPEAIVSQSENSLRIRLTDIPEYAAVQLAFLAMGNARVLKPASLQDSLKQVAQNIFDNNK